MLLSTRKTILGSIFSAAALFGSAQSQAVVITFGGQNATDGSGLTSNFVPASNTGLSTGFFIETFDQATYQALPAVDGTFVGIGGPGTSGITDLTGLGLNGEIAQDLDCSINSWGGPTITATGGGFGVRSGTVTGAAAPANNTTCYGFGPLTNSTTTIASVKIDYSPLLAPGDSINYLGLYWGSIDNYNEILFYSGDTLLRTLTGQEVLASQGGTTGNQFQPGSNVYVNLAFAAVDAFTAFEFRTTQRAFEFDNIVVGLSSRPPVVDVPAPASLALTGLGLLGLAVSRRRRRI